MDFANLVYTNRNPDIENSPLQPHCIYCRTNGALEETTQNKKSSFPTNEAQTLLILHENHKKYFSTQKQSFAPFILPEPLNTRARIKAYFERVYGLKISIRPPYKKDYIGETPTLYTRAQILLGDHTFTEYTKEDVQTWLKNQESDRIRV